MGGKVVRRMIAVGSSFVLTGAFVVASAAPGSTQTDEGDETSAAQAASGSKTFEYTGDAKTFTIPSGVTAIHVKVSGAEGGDGSTCTFVPQPFPCGEAGSGGEGATVSGVVPVTAGETLKIIVGGQGEDATPSVNGPPANTFGEGGDGGFGLGEGGDGASAQQPLGPSVNVAGAGGGGGGASAILRDATPLAVAAGGGGGGGGGVGEISTQPGGGDGGESGEDGDDGKATDGFDCAGSGGEAAHEDEGGEGGNGGVAETCDPNPPVDGAAGNDGDAGNDAAEKGDGGDGGLAPAVFAGLSGAGAGGGGGGYAGGGGGGAGAVQPGILGPGGGGGGGSCLVPEAGTRDDGVRSGDGVVEITYVYAVVAEPTFTG